jgi:pimeloyl-ACP methyl ester carboxylesterase
MSDTKPTILITHGAWHHPAYFSSVIDLLKAQGYKVVCPHLPTCNNDDTPTKTLDDDVALIRSTASSLADEEQEIVALMHSYGGVVGTDALYGLSTTERAKSGLKGGLKRLLYMCAFIPQKGQSLAGIFGGRMPPYIVEKVNQGSIFCSKSLPIYVHWIRFQQEGLFLGVEDPNQRFYHDTADPGHWSAQLLKHPKAAQFTAVSHEAFREVPITYLLCENDQALPMGVQKMMIGRIEEVGVKVGTIESCEGSHSPFLSMPEKVVEVVVRAAEAP